VKNLARYLGEIKGPHLWIWAAAGEAETSLWQADLSGGAVFVLGAEGKGLRPLVRRTCDDAISIPLYGGVESLNVSVAAALLLTRPGGSVAEPTLYLFDGYNLLHAGEFEDPRELVDALASFVAVQGARG
jgi:hypothetical protein